MEPRRTPRFAASLQEVLDFVANHGDEVFGASTARNMRTALQQVHGAMGDGEPDDITWVVDHLGELVQRLIERRKLNPVSAASYRSRVRISAARFFDWKDRQRNGAPQSESPRPAPVVVSDANQPIVSRLRNGYAHLHARQVDVPRGLQQEVSEAMFYAARWPHLQKYILDALTKAVQEAADKERAK